MAVKVVEVSVMVAVSVDVEEGIGAQAASMLAIISATRMGMPDDLALLGIAAIGHAIQGACPIWVQSASNQPP